MGPRPTRILVDEVKLKDRVLGDDDISELADDIEANGLKFPILVNGDYELIDGLRRLEAVASTGATTIEAYVTNNAYEMFEILTPLQMGLDLEKRPRRFVRLYNDLRAAHKNTRAEMQRTGRWNKSKRLATDPPKMDFRKSVKESLHIPHYDQHLERLARVYRAAEMGAPTAMELIRQLDDGLIDTSSAVNGWLGPKRAPRELLVSTSDEQLSVLAGGVRQLSVVVRGLRKLHTPLEVPANELEAIAKTIRGVRTELFTLLRKVEQQVTKKKES